MNRKHYVIGAFSAGLLALSACGESTPVDADAGNGGEGGEVATESVVELFSWWTAPGEAEALQALIDVHKDAFPNARIRNAAAESGDNAREVLATRLAADDPPDLFQDNAHEIPLFLQENPGKLTDLTSFFAETGYSDAILGEILSKVTVDGKIYAMPVNLHRENGVFFNKEVMAANGIDPPASLTDLMTACATLNDAGIVPIAISYQSWILRIMFTSIAMSSMGTDKFNAYFSGDAAGDDPAMRQAIEDFDLVLTECTSDSAEVLDSDTFGWTQAADQVFDGEAAMFFHGDWVKGYYQQLGWTPGVDFEVAPAPGTGALFLYGSDVFTMPTGGPNPEGALDFLKTVGSSEGQVAFNVIKGSSPVRTDVTLSDLDPVATATLQDLKDAEIRMLVPRWDTTLADKEAWDIKIQTFATSRDVDALVDFFTDTYPGR